MPRFPEYAYYSRNYEFKKIVLDEKPKYIVFDKADFLNVVSSTADISKVYISINGGDFVKLSGVVPVTTPFSNVVLTWDDSENGKEIDIIVGHELFVPSTQSITIVGDLIGLAKDSSIQTLIDYLDLAPYPITNYTGKFTGTWTKENFIDSPSGYRWYSNDHLTPASVEVTFYGTKALIIFTGGTNAGIANIYVDGNLIDSVDLYNTQSYYWSYLISGLSDGKHTLKIEVSSSKNVNSSDYYVQIGGLYFEAGKNPVQDVDRYVRDRVNSINGYLTNQWNGGLINPRYGLESSTPLDANASFTGSWIDTSLWGYTYIIVLVYSDVDGTLYIEQSPDQNTIVRSDSLSYTGGDTENNLAKVQVMSRYVRLRYVNGATAQTVFYLTRRFSMA